MKTSHTPKDLLAMVRVGDRFHRGDDENARIYKFIERPGRSEDGEPALVVECSMFGAFPDIYEGLEMFALGTDHRAVAIALTTCGWAVPYTRDENGSKIDAMPGVSPSEHPDRKRVSLLFVLTDDHQQGSRLVLVDSGEVLEEDEGGSNEAHGQLLDACGMALSFHRADKEHLRDLIESTRHRLAEGMTLDDFGFGNDLPAD